MTALTRRLQVGAAALCLVVLGAPTVTVTAAAGSLERGSRCTITGTAKADKLAGTKGRDVICGLGGDDVIKGRSGNDLLVGGTGDDTLAGGDGVDVLKGGRGADALNGGDDADVLDAGAGNDVVKGERGPDRLRGKSGNDDMDGGPQTDDVDGGPGTNWCSTDPADTQNRCVHDEAPAVAQELVMSPSVVDVTDDDRPVQLRVRVTDDTGVDEVRISLRGADDGNSFAGSRNAYLDGGTVRNGWWTTTIEVPRWLEPGAYLPEVMLKDRVNHWSDRSWSSPQLTVIDRNPDRSAPVVAALTSPAPGFTADVRGAARTVQMRARLTDGQSGIGQAYFCLVHPTTGGYTNLPCAVPTKVSGTRNDGWWEGAVTIPKGAGGGDWNVSIWLQDRAHPERQHYWVGPDQFRVWIEDGWYEDNLHELPGGTGRFQVIGTNDSSPPSLQNLTVTPSVVDTLPGPVTVAIRMHAVDVEGVTDIGTWVHRQPESPADPGEPMFAVQGFQLVSGTSRNGIWEADLTLPQGTPSGDYWFSAWLMDVSHWRSYVSASSPNAAQPNQDVMAWDPTITVVP